MSPNKRKTYLRKLLKRGYTINEVIDLFDLLNAQVSHYRTHGESISNFDEIAFDKIKKLLVECTRIGLGYEDLLKLDTRPYLIGYLSARLKNYEHHFVSFEDVLSEAEDDNDYFLKLERILFFHSLNITIVHISQYIINKVQ